MSPERPSPSPSPDGFILRLAEALHRYGTPAHRLEDVMTALCRRLGIEGRFFSTPTAIFASFGPPQALRTCLIRIEPGDFDMERLSLLDALTGDVIRGGRTPESGAVLVERILARPERYPPWLRLLCHAVSGAAAAVLFRGSARETLFAAIISTGIGILAVATKRAHAVARLKEPIAAVGAAVFAATAARFAGPISKEVVILGGIIVLLPGLTLTVAINELATRNLVSGTSRLMGAALTFLHLGFGIALGGKLSAILPPAFGPLPETYLPFWGAIVALVAASLSLMVLFRASPRDAGWILAGGALAYGGARLGSLLVGVELGAFVGALLLGLGSNTAARAVDRPAVVTILPGLTLLVPGTLGVRSLESLVAQDVVAGVGAAFSAVFVAVSLVAGLLVANAIVPTRKAL